MALCRWLAFAALLLALVTAPGWAPPYGLLFLLLCCLYLALAQMWNLLAGYAGLLCLGQQAFIGVGGYALAVLVTDLGLNPGAAVLAGGAVSVLLALFMSLFIFRMRGVYFAIGTWVFAEVLMLWCSNWPFVNYAAGMYVKPVPPVGMDEIYFGALSLAVLSTVVVIGVMRSRSGLGLLAIRDSEAVAEAMGVDVLRAKFSCFLTAAFVTGATGGVFYLFQVFIQPYAAFSIGWTVKLFFIVIIGGIGTVEGPIVGAVIYVLLSQGLAEYGAWGTLLPGIVAIVVMLTMPGGIMGALAQQTGWAWLPTRRT